MNSENTPGVLQAFSQELSRIVEQAAPAIVRVDDGSRLTATGWVWSADGLIVTTSHGVERDDSLSVELHNGTTLPAELVGRDSDTDVALLRVNASGLTALPQANTDSVRVGQLTLALARPGRLGLQATFGMLSARLDTQSEGRDEYLLHTDALLFPGFSGGPLVNVSGQAVGMVNLSFGRGKGVAVGLPVVANAAQSLLSGGKARRGYLGVRTQLVVLPANLRERLQLEQERALLLMQIEPGSGAEAAGLMLGDTLLAVNGQATQDVDDLRTTLRSLRAGQNAALSLVRGGERHEATVALGAQE